MQIDLKPHNSFNYYFFCNSIWESNIEPSSAKKTWDELTEAERAAAVVLGYSEKKVNNLVKLYLCNRI